MTYASDADVRSVSGIGTTIVGTADMSLFLTFADRQVEAITGKVWTGQQTKEFLGRGDDENDTFYTRCHPVLSALESSGGTTTNNSGHVTVYLDDVEQGTAVYLLYGQDGRVVFGSDYIPDDDEKVTCTYYYSLNDMRMAAAYLASSFAFYTLQQGEKQKQFEEKGFQILEPYRFKKFGWSYH